MSETVLSETVFSPALKYAPPLVSRYFWEMLMDGVTGILPIDMVPVQVVLAGILLGCPKNQR